MSLPSPNLDDRTFEDIVSDVKRQIARRCPEWTEHNASDPGVTLIELFAWMTEMMLYRMNQVPEKNYVKFLEMLGVTLSPPAPAVTDLRLRLSRAIEDRDGEEAFERTLRARETVAATIRTDTEDAIEFATDADLRLVRPRLAHIAALPAAALDNPNNHAPRLFAPSQNAWLLFSPIPREGDCLYLGFDNDVSGCLIELEADCVQAAATGLDEDYPAQRWEVWNGVENRYDPLEVASDATYGFNRPPGQMKNDLPTGYIELAMPTRLLPTQVGGQRAYWVRCRYTLDLPPRGNEQKRPAPYLKSPEIRSLSARTVGGTVSASNSSTVLGKELGRSDGLPGQVFGLGHAPILARYAGETVVVGEQGSDIRDMQMWTEVIDFAESGPDDRHYVCDGLAGEVRFGPSVIQPDGSARQHGAIPAKGLTVLFTAYRYGGGTQGNVAARQISVLKSSIPYIADVGNPRRADGGRAQETLERAKMRGQAVLRLRDRAVTAEDYEFLALRASSGVGRARCVQPRALHAAGADGERIPPGVVRVLLVPALGEAVSVPRPADLRVPARVRQEVQAFLDERRLLTTVLEVAEPNYVYVSTDITLVPDPRADADQVARAVRARLDEYLHPLRGGPNGTGWPFRRPLTLSDIYAQVQAARNVAFLLDARIYVSRLANAEDVLLGAEELVSNVDGVRPGDNDLLCTREHRIRIRPMWAVGMEGNES